MFRSGTWLGVTVQGGNRETTRNFWVDDRRVACEDTLQPPNEILRERE